MNMWEASILGLIQGVAEFLPISSSGHLTLMEHFLKLEEAPIAVNLALHMATLLVIVIHFRQRILSLLWPLNLNYLKAVVVTSIPTAIIGLAIKKGALFIFEDSFWSMAFLMLNGIGLITLATILGKRPQVDNGPTDLAQAPSLKMALGIGVVQGIAALPGISRSGSTIGFARLCGMAPRQAAEYSLLVTIPVIFGAALLECSDFSQLGAWGSVVAFLSGWFAVSLLLKIVDKNAWKNWGFYCIAVSLLYGAYLYG
jgi:undecaprenyl-diphosphatase